MKLLCIKSYEAPSGHFTVKHILGKTYIQNDDTSIIDEYGNKFWWDDDMIKDYFKSTQDIRNEVLEKLCS